MTERKTTIFRPEAVRRYIESQEKAVLPRLVSPRAFAGLWALFALSLALLAAAAGLARVPAYAEGVGFAAGTPGLADGGPGAVTVVALLPAEQYGHLRAGQVLLLSTDEPGRALRGQVVAIEPTLLDPAEAAQRFGAPSTVGAGTMAVLTARLESAPPGALAPGRAYAVRVQIGTITALRLLAGQMDLTQEAQ
jgi:hypothetical protein